MINCLYWSRTRDRGQGTCALAFHGGKPWPGECLACLAAGANIAPVEASAPEQSKSAWPVVLRPMRLLARGGDRGLGDVAARVIGPVGGEAFKAWFQRVLGRSCGCEARQEALNRRWPLG